MSDILISCDAHDIAHGRALARVLEANGFKSALAHEAGFDARDLVARHKVTLILWSRAAIANDDCVEEASLALAGGTLVAARLDDGRPPPVFSSAAPVDLRGWTGVSDHRGVADLLRQLRARFGRDEAATAAPIMVGADLSGEGAGPPNLDDQTVRVTLISAPRLRRPKAAAQPAAQPLYEDEAEAGAGFDYRRMWMWGGSAAALAVAVLGFAAFRVAGQADGIAPRTSSADAASAEPRAIWTPPAEVLARDAAADAASAAAEAAPQIPLIAAPQQAAAAAPPPAPTPRRRPARPAPAGPLAGEAVVEAVSLVTPAVVEGPPRPNLASPTGGYNAVELEPVVRQQVERARRAAAQAGDQALRARSASAGAEAWVARLTGGEYAGEWSNGAANGFGEARLDSGEVYAGGWRGSRRHGDGVLLYANGCRYEGEFVNGAPTGRGAFWDAQGRRLTGGALFRALSR